MAVDRMLWLRRGFFVTSLGGAICAVAFTIAELVGKRPVPWLALFLLAGATVYAAWCFLRYFALLPGLRTDRTAFDWSLTLAIWLTGLVCIRSVSEPDVCIILFGVLSLMSAIKSSQLAARTTEDTRQLLYTERARIELFVCAAIAALLVVSVWSKQQALVHWVTASLFLLYAVAQFIEKIRRFRLEEQSIFSDGSDC